MDARDRAVVIGIIGSHLAMLAVIFCASRVGFQNWAGNAIWLVLGPPISLGTLLWLLRTRVAGGKLVRGVASELLEKLAIFPLIMWTGGIATRTVFGHGAEAARRPEFGTVVLFLIVFLGLLTLSMIVWSRFASFLERRFPWRDAVSEAEAHAAQSKE